MREDQKNSYRGGVCKCVTVLLFLFATTTSVAYSFGSLLPNMSLNHVTRLNRPKFFLYFAYGSNLLTERIHINNPSAKAVGVGKVMDYRLDFNLFSNRWKGAVATIVEEEGNHVYGVLWELAMEDMANLDKQENVDDKVYRVINVNVETLKGDCVKARSYQIVAPLEGDRRPSCVYLDVITRGAKENGLPEEYIKYLESIKSNGYNGTVDVDIKRPSLQPSNFQSVSG